MARSLISLREIPLRLASRLSHCVIAMRGAYKQFFSYDIPRDSDWYRACFEKSSFSPRDVRLLVSCSGPDSVSQKPLSPFAYIVTVDIEYNFQDLFLPHSGDAVAMYVVHGDHRIGCFYIFAHVLYRYILSRYQNAGWDIESLGAADIFSGVYDEELVKIAAHELRHEIQLQNKNLPLKTLQAVFYDYGDIYPVEWMLEVEKTWSRRAAALRNRYLGRSDIDATQLAARLAREEDALVTELLAESAFYEFSRHRERSRFYLEMKNLIACDTG